MNVSKMGNMTLLLSLLLLTLHFLGLLCSGFASGEHKTAASKVTVFKPSQEAQTRRSQAFLRTLIPLSTTALTYGLRQVQRMLQDRPAMGRYVTAGDPIHTYAVQMFAGAAAGTRIAWHSEPPSGSYADHQYPTPDQPGFIRVRRCYLTGARQGQECTGEELWSAAIFELNNIRNAKLFRENYRQAYFGKINKQEYIATNTRLEYKALQESLEVYAILWKPCMQAKGIAVNPAVWYTDLPPTYTEWIALYTDNRSYPWVPYSKYFDNIVSARNRWVSKPHKAATHGN